MSDPSADGLADRLGAVGTAYVDFALTQPGLFRAAFATHPTAGGHHKRDSSTTRKVEAQTDRAEPYEILGEVLDQAQSAGLLDPDRRPGAAIAAWSAVHGLASLLVEGPLPASPADIDFALGQVLGLVGRGLLKQPPAPSGSAPDGQEERH